MAATPRPPADGGPLRRSSAALGRLRRLSRRREARREEGLLLVDGPVLLSEAVEAGVGLVEVFVEEGAATVVDLPGDVPVHTVADGELAKVLDVVTPRGVVAVVRRPEATIAGVLEAAERGARPVVVLVEVQDPGNAGTLVRVAEAAGAAGVLLTRGSVDVWGPKAVRAAAGSSLRIPVVDDLDPQDVLDAAAGRGLRTVGTAPGTGDAPESADLTGALLLLLGNEAHGLAPALLGRLEEVVTIPMAGRVESVNAAVAGSVLLFEAARQRRTGTGGRPRGGGGS